MSYLDEVALTEILKAWGFTRHPLTDGAAWAAPTLPKLREALKAKYPAIEWDHPYVTNWGDTIDMKRQKQRQEEERQHPKKQQQEEPQEEQRDCEYVDGSGGTKRKKRF